MHNARVPGDLESAPGQFLARRKCDRLPNRIHRQPNRARLPLTGEIIGTSAFMKEQCLCHEVPCDFERSSRATTTFRPVVIGRRAYSFVLGTRLQPWRTPAKTLALEPNRFAAREPDRPEARAGPTDAASARHDPRDGLGGTELTDDNGIGRRAEKPASPRRFPQRTGQTSGRVTLDRRRFLPDHRRHPALPNLRDERIGK